MNLVASDGVPPFNVKSGHEMNGIGISKPWLMKDGRVSIDPKPRLSINPRRKT